MVGNISKGNKKKQNGSVRAVQMKTSKVINLYPTLRNAKTGPLSGDATLTVVRAVRRFKEIVDEFNSLRDDVSRKFRDEQWDDMIKKNTEIQIAREKKAELPAYTKEVDEYFAKYNEKMIEALNEDYQAEHELNIKQLEQEDFAKLVNANQSWNVDMSIRIAEILCIDVLDD